MLSCHVGAIDTKDLTENVMKGMNSVKELILFIDIDLVVAVFLS
jgi:hypothetical protein